MLSILSGGKSKEWKEGIGLRNNKLRKVCVFHAFANAQTNLFGKFKEMQDMPADNS